MNLKAKSLMTLLFLISFKIVFAIIFGKLLKNWIFNSQNQIVLEFHNQLIKRLKSFNNRMKNNGNNYVKNLRNYMYA